MERSSIYSLLIAIALLGFWETACWGFDIPDFILPAPSRILAVAVTGAGILLPHAAVTAMEVLTGIMLSLLVAVPLATVMFAHPAVEKGLAPFLVASQAVPVFAVAPLLVVWLGYGMASKVLMAAVIIFFPITVNLLEGFKSCDQEFRVLFQLMGAGFWKTLRYLYWPWALPHFFCRIESRRFRCDHRCGDRRVGGRPAGPRLSDDPGQCQIECRHGLCRHFVVVAHGIVAVDSCRIFGEKSD